MLGEVCLVNGNGKRFWGVRELDGGVNNAAVILFAAAGGKDIQSVRKFEHCIVVDSAGERRCVINCLGFFFLLAEFINNGDLERSINRRRRRLRRDRQLFSKEDGTD